MKDMINSAKRNRSLLKGNDAAAYRSFDTKSYKATATKAPTFQYSSKEQIKSIRDRIIAENEQTQRTKRLLMIVSISLIGLLTVILFTIRF